MKNVELKDMILTLEKESSKNEQNIWRAIAEELDKAKNRRNVVNLSRINRNTEAGDVIAVPGKVLGSGWINHPVTIAAYKFSEIAREKIEYADGEAIKLTDLIKNGIEPSKIRIIK